MASLTENIQQTIADFDSIKAAIEDKGVQVGNIPTSQYAEKISKIQGGGSGFDFDGMTGYFDYTSYSDGIWTNQIDGQTVDTGDTTTLENNAIKLYGNKYFSIPTEFTPVIYAVVKKPIDEHCCLFGTSHTSSGAKGINLWHDTVGGEWRLIMSKVGTPYLTNAPENPNDYHVLCIGAWKSDDDNSYDSYYFIVDEKLICSYPASSIYNDIKSGFAGSIVLGRYIPTESPCTKDSYYRCLAFGTKSDIATAINNCKYLYKTYITG